MSTVSASFRKILSKSNRGFFSNQGAGGRGGVGVGWGMSERVTLII